VVAGDAAPQIRVRSATLPSRGRRERGRSQ
jgi:hypothetical protein